MCSNKRLTILFITLDNYGHLNGCIGLAEKLIARKHRVIFAIENSWRGKASQYDGIEERTYVDPTRDPTLDANEYWIKYMEGFCKKFPLDALEGLRQIDTKFKEDFLYTLLNVDHLLADIIADVKPDVIVCDTLMTIPAILKSGRNWVWFISAAPLMALPHEDLPPSGTGYPTNGDRTKWVEYRQLKAKKYGSLLEQFVKQLKQKFAINEVMEKPMKPSPYLNVYAYPLELDYLDVRPLPDNTWQRFDHFVRQTERANDFAIPERLLKAHDRGKLIYVSMGSLGAADRFLMRRLITMLCRSPNRFVFSLGPHADELRQLLGPNHFGKPFLPQTVVLPAVDLVISHGGNNTLLETLYFGKPILISPLFSDQRDNGQRVREKQFGGCINLYHCTEQELIDKIERLLADEELRRRVTKLGERMRASRSTEKLAIAVESLALQFSTGNNQVVQ